MDSPAASLRTAIRELLGRMYIEGATSVCNVALCGARPGEGERPARGDPRLGEAETGAELDRDPRGRDGWYLKAGMTGATVVLGAGDRPRAVRGGVTGAAARGDSALAAGVTSS